MRQKIGNVNLNYFILEQVPTLPPDAYDEKCPWAPSKRLLDWIADRVLKLTCTAEDMIPFADAAGFKERVHKWKQDERRRLRAELDAAYLLLYGLDREDAEYILSTFTSTRRRDTESTGRYSTADAVLEAYDRFRWKMA